MKIQIFLFLLKPLSVTTNVVGLQIDDTAHVDQNSSAHAVCIVDLQTGDVVVTEARLSKNFKLKRLITIVKTPNSRISKFPDFLISGFLGTN